MKFYALGEFIDKRKVKRFHRDLPEFDKKRIYNIQIEILKKTTSFSFVSHFEERKNEKNIPDIDPMDALKFGSCFEYKMVYGKIFRLALRVSGRRIGIDNEDFIFIVEPFVKANGEMEVKFVTCYGNRKGDTHRTLRVSQYQY